MNIATKRNFQNNPVCRLSNHPFFKEVKDINSGIHTYILNKRVAPLQQSFYFTNSSLSPNEEWLWFYCSFPPAQYRTLGVVSLNPDNPTIHHFPHLQFTSQSPMVSPSSDGIYFCVSHHIYYSDVSGNIRKIASLDEKWRNNRPVTMLASHLTLSADGRHFLLDGQIGNHWFIATADTQSGDIHVLKEFTAHHNHAQFSPLIPDLFLIAEDWWHDPVSGQFFPYDHRIWLMDTTEKRYEPLMPQDYFGHNSHASHEWWSGDGRVCWVDYHRGAYEYDLETRSANLVWAEPLCHAHCNRDRSLWCADQSPYEWETRQCEVLLFERSSGRRIAIASLQKPRCPRSPYHPDPHPHFSPLGNYICYTTTDLGSLDVALCPVDHTLTTYDG
jgi:Tol biopolymer transport system component